MLRAEIDGIKNGKTIEKKSMKHNAGSSKKKKINEGDKSLGKMTKQTNTHPRRNGSPVRIQTEHDHAPHSHEDHQEAVQTTSHANPTSSEQGPPTRLRTFYLFPSKNTYHIVIPQCPQLSPVEHLNDFHFFPVTNIAVNLPVDKSCAHLPPFLRLMPLDDVF